MPRHTQSEPTRLHRPLALGSLLCAVVLVIVVLSGCGADDDGSGDKSARSAAATKTVGERMAGPVVDVAVSKEAFDSRPRAWVLDTPESAVRSYIDWVSYAWRIGQSQVATPTMTTYEEVRVDSFVQYNLQKSRLIDQTLKEITFRAPSVESSRAVLSAREKWTYRYVSIKNAGETVGGPYQVSYDTTYTVVRSTRGEWVVDKVTATALDEVK